MSGADVTDTTPATLAVVHDRRTLPQRVLSNSLSHLLLVWGATFAYFSVTQPQFLTSGNLSNTLDETALIFVVAIAETIIILMAGIDLSAGSLLALTTLVMVMVNHGTPEWLAILATMGAAGALATLVNGLPIGVARMNPFVVTLGSAAVFRGVANLTTDGNTYVLSHSSISAKLSSGEIGPIPVTAVVMAVVLGLFYFLLRFTYFGRDIYAIGGNEEAAALAGVRVKRIKVISYGIVGVVVGFAAVMQAGRLSSVAPSAGVGLELTAVAAVLLGGTSLVGGRGSVIGTAVAVLFLATVDDGLRVSGVSSWWQGIVTGTILIVAVGFEQFRAWFVATRRTTTTTASQHKEKDT